jgi:hypothetical protein
MGRWAISGVSEEIKVTGLKTKAIAAQEGSHLGIVESSAARPIRVPVQPRLAVVLLAGEQKPRGGLRQRRVVV